MPSQVVKGLLSGRHSTPLFAPPYKQPPLIFIEFQCCRQINRHQTISLSFSISHRKYPLSIRTVPMHVVHANIASFVVGLFSFFWKCLWASVFSAILRRKCAALAVCVRAPLCMQYLCQLLITEFMRFFLLLLLVLHIVVVHTRLIELFGAGKKIERRSTFTVMYWLFSTSLAWFLCANEKTSGENQLILV